MPPTRSSDILGPWRRVASHLRPVWWSDEGLATFGRGTVWRGAASVPLGRRIQGWVHIGDPDARDSVIVDCYQGRPGATSKLFTAAGSGNRRLESTHRLVTAPDLAPPELMNNSFVAIAPNGQWMLSGEWGSVHRLLIFPTPLLNPSAGRDLPLAGVLDLDRPVRNVQGAAWLDARTVLLSTDDPGTDLWPADRQLLQVDLEGPLDGGDARGRVRYLGPLPLESRCSGTFEVEGLDYDPGTGDLRVIVIPPPPCRWVTATVHTYHRG